MFKAKLIISNGNFSLWRLFMYIINKAIIKCIKYKN